MSKMDEDFFDAFTLLTQAHVNLDSNISEILVDPENENLFDHAESDISDMESAIRRLRQLLEQNRPPSV